MDLETEVDTDAAPSLRDTLSAQFEETPEPIAAEVVEPAAEPADTETAAEAAQRARDEAGRFAKEKAAKTGKPVTAAKPAPVAVKPVLRPGSAVAPVAPAAVAVEMKAPQSWRGPAKETWAALPEAARVEVLRREKEHATALTTFAEDRKFAGTMRETLRPFEAQIRAEGSTPERAIGNLMNTALALRTAPPAHKADLVAGMLSDFNVPLDLLVRAIEARQGGQPAPQGQPQHQAPQQFDPNQFAAQVEQRLMAKLGAQRESQLVAKYTAETEGFLEKQPMHGPDGTDFGADIREDMADIIERAAKRGSTITLEQAYNLAARQHPEVSKVLTQRDRAASATKTQVSTQRARAAAVSVRNQPATQPVARNDGNSLRDTLEAALSANL